VEILVVHFWKSGLCRIRFIKAYTNFFYSESIFGIFGTIVLNCQICQVSHLTFCLESILMQNLTDPISLKQVVKRSEINSFYMLVKIAFARKLN
jgi:hypothetical protein